MTLSKEEVAVLKMYFDESRINITGLIKKIGLRNTEIFENMIDKVYKEDGSVT